MTLELNEKVALWRQKQLDGTLTIEDTREYIRLLRENRLRAAQSSSEGQRKRAKAAIPSADDSLRELEDL